MKFPANSMVEYNRRVSLCSLFQSLPSVPMGRMKPEASLSVFSFYIVGCFLLPVLV